MQERYIDTAEDLQVLCQELSQESMLALDTEFLREKTYYPQLCLIQVAGENIAACIDPLAIDDLGPLLDLLYRPDIVKVLHSARQDLEIFYQLRGALPEPIFDTQIAATLAGFGDQIGYSNLVQQILGITLDKSHTRTDWSLRPLSEEQQRYALNDVTHLWKIYHQLHKDLEKRGRLGWLQPDFDSLSNPKLYDIAPNDAWQRIKGTQKLRGVQMAVLAALAAWREQRAQESDKPRKWILDDNTIVDLARLMPDKTAKLSRLRSLDAGTIRRQGDTLIKLISDAKQTPKEQWPQPKGAGKRPSVAQEAASDLLMSVIRLRAAEHGVSPNALANRKELDALVGGSRKLPVLEGWRCTLVGNDLVALLEGRGSLRFEAGVPVIDN